MSVPKTVAAAGGAWDIVLQIGTDTTKRMGFLTVDEPDESRISDFAPAIRLGSDPAFSEGIFQQATFPSFHEGGDKQNYESGSQRYNYSDAGVQLQLSELVKLSSRWNSGDASVTPTASMILDFTDDSTFDYIMVATGTKFRLYDDASGLWADEYPSAGVFAGNCTSFFATDQYLFAAIGSSGDFWRFNGTKSTGWAQPAAAVKAHAFFYLKGVLYRAYQHQIVPATANDGSTWGTAVDVGWASSNIEDLWVGNSYLLISKPEGLYVYDGTTLTQIDDASTLRALGNYAGGTAFHGSIYTSVMSSIFQVSLTSAISAAFTDITPKMKGDASKELYGHGDPVRMIRAPNDVYVVLDDGEGVYPEVLQYNGIGWHQVYRGTSGATMCAAGYSRIKGWLIINDGTTRYKLLSNLSGEDSADYNTSGYFTTPWFDAGIPNTVKAFRDITVETRSCDASNTVAVAYEIDESGTWVAIDTLSSTGKSTMTLGGISSQIAAKKIRFKFTLTRDATDATKTPVIQCPVIIGVLPTPEATHGLAVTVDLNPNTKLRPPYDTLTVGDAYTVEQALDLIDQIEDATDTIEFVDDYNRLKFVKNTDFSRVGSGRYGLEPGLFEAPVIALRFAEVFSGLLVRGSEPLSVADSEPTMTDVLTGTNLYGSQIYGLGIYGDW